MPAAANREPTVPRRAVSRGVAWAVPTIALATAAPALAASEPCTDADTLTALPAFTAQNWTEQPATGFRGGNRYPVEWLTNYRNEGEPAAHNKADPAAGQAAYATITSVETFCLAPGSYRVRYRTGLLVTNGRSMWLYGEVHEEGGRACAGAPRRPGAARRTASSAIRATTSPSTRSPGCASPSPGRWSSTPGNRPMRRATTSTSTSPRSRRRPDRRRRGRLGSSLVGSGRLRGSCGAGRRGPMLSSAHTAPSPPSPSPAEST